MAEYALSVFDRTLQMRMNNVEKTQNAVVIETQKKSKNCRSALPERCAFTTEELPLERAEPPRANVCRQPPSSLSRSQIKKKARESCARNHTISFK